MKRACVKFLSAVCLLLFFSAAAHSQDGCAFVTNSTPVALNLRLGMTPLEVRAALGKSPKISNKTKGDYRFFQNYINQSPPPNLAGVRALYLRFFDGRLYQMEVFYEPSFAPTLEDFMTRVSQSYGFSSSPWTREKIAAVIRCGENKIVADYVLNPRLELANETVLEKVNQLNKSKK